MQPEDAAAALRSHVPLRLGTLRVYGDWFGRPMDNIHTAVSAQARGDVLVVGFDQAEILEVVNPQDIKLDPDAASHRMIIRRADRVRWRWYSYGRPHVAENLFVEEHWLDGDTVRATTTANWYTPQFQPSLDQPAVDFVLSGML